MDHSPRYALLGFPNQAAIIAGLSDILCFLLTHEILNTRQDMLAGLKKAHSKQTALPVPPLFPPHPTFPYTTIGRQSEFWRFLFKKYQILYCKTFVFNLLIDDCFYYL